MRRPVLRQETKTTSGTINMIGTLIDFRKEMSGELKVEMVGKGDGTTSQVAFRKTKVAGMMKQREVAGTPG